MLPSNKRDLENHFVKCTVLSLYEHCNQNVASLLRCVTDTLHANGRHDVKLDIDGHGAVMTVTQGVERTLSEYKDFTHRAGEISASHGSPMRRPLPLRETHPVPHGDAAFLPPARLRRSTARTSTARSSSIYSRSSNTSTELTALNAPGPSHRKHVETFNGDYILRRYGGRAYQKK